MAKVKNRRDNHNIKRPRSGAAYGESRGTGMLREEHSRSRMQSRFADQEKSGTRERAALREQPGMHGKPSPQGRYGARDKFAPEDRYGARDKFAPEDRYGAKERDRSDIIIGRNPVTEALKAGREIDKLMVTSREGSMIKILAMAKEQGIPVMYVEKPALDRLSEGKAHQGVAAYVSPYAYSDVDSMLMTAEERGEEPFLIVLDGLEDPHNLGAIMRTAECAGAHGIIIPKRHSCGLTETVAKASAGAIEYMPVAKVTNIAKTIDELKERGIWTACCDMGGTEYYEADVSGKIAVVIGSEGFGVSKLVRDKCDFTVSMPMKGRINSLNASNAAAIMIYEVRRQRDSKRAEQTGL